MDCPKRKLPRLKGYDYATCNYYYVTVCTADKRHVFGKVGLLSRFGQIAEEEIRKIPGHYTSVRVDKYVVMPNHVHMILVLDGLGEDTQVPTLSTVVGSYKAGVTRRIHEISPKQKVWQTSFYDSIIRNERMYQEIWKYIDGNPANWEADEH